MATTAIRITNNLVNEAKQYAQLEHRSTTAQIEYWTKIGKCAVENPDLSYTEIKDILLGITEIDLGYNTEYKFG
jgi:hypothetical protein